MIKIKIRNICALFFGILSIPIVTTHIVFAVPFPAIEEFVSAGSQNKIQQVPNSKWCVPTCIDIASAYIVRALKRPADISVKHNILVNGAVHENITDNGLDLEGQFEAIEIGVRIIPLISSAPMARIKDMIYNNGDRTVILPYDDYKRSGKPGEFLKNALYKRPAGQRHNWKCNNNVCVIISGYLHKELTAFTDKDREEEVNETLDQFVSSLQESDLQKLYSLNKAIPCLHWNLPFAKEFIEGKLNKWFQKPELVAKIGYVQCNCEVKDVLPSHRKICFEDIIDNINRGKVIMLDCNYAIEGGGGHACIVVGRGNDSNRQFLEVYNPDPSYRGTNPMIMNESLTYVIRGEKDENKAKKVVDHYAIITPITPAIPEEAPKEENKS